MADYFLDDAANGTNDGASWETCYNTWAQVASAGILATGGNRLFVGADANITDPGAALTLTGPTSGLPVYIISSTVGSNITVSYSAGTGNQVYTTVGDITFDGSFALYGLKANCTAAGADIVFQNDSNEQFYHEDCTLLPGDGSYVQLATSSSVSGNGKNLTIDVQNDSGASSTDIVTITAATYDLCKVTISDAGSTSARTGYVFAPAATAGVIRISGGDISNCTSATVARSLGGSLVLNNIITEASPTLAPAVAASGPSVMMVNVGPADDPSMLYLGNYYGVVQSSTAHYRTGGAVIEDVSQLCWQVTTTANCSEGSPFYTPWIYGAISSTGSKTFTLCIAHDDGTYSANLTNAQIWLEVEYFSAADEAGWAIASDHRTITAAAAAQDADSSTWNTSGGPAFDYKQKLVASATVAEAGQFRARVAIGLASVVAGDYLLIDPKVVVA